MATRTTATGTTTLTLTAEEYSSSSAASAPVTTAEEIPLLPTLLLALDAAPRDDAAQSDLVRTVRSLLTRAELDGRPPVEYLQLAVLVVFKRRNHTKSQAGGTGPGERRVLRSLLIEAYNSHPALVRAVLPLVPVYGSWRDLQVMAEISCPIAPVADAAAESEEVTLSLLAQDIATVFSLQLQRDAAEADAEEASKNAMDVATTPLSDSDAASTTADTAAAAIGTSAVRFVQSNACKYAPHEFRHRSMKKDRRSGAVVKVARERKVQRKLGDAIAAALFQLPAPPTVAAAAVPQSRVLRPRYRKLLSRLNARLTARGFLIEPLLCTSQVEAIDFRCAAKGALAKYRAAIMKNPAAASKWRSAMRSSAAAVADIDQLVEFTRSVKQELQQPAEERSFPLRLRKAVTTTAAAMQQLRGKVGALLKQLQQPQSSSESDSSNDSSNSEGEQLALQTAAVMELLSAASGVVALPVVDSAQCSAEQFLCLLTEAFVAAQAQDIAFIIVDGELLPLPPANSNSKSSSSSGGEGGEDRASEADVSDFFERAVTMAESVAAGASFNSAAAAVRRLDDLQRLRSNCVAALVAHQHTTDSSEGCSRCDVLYFTSTGLPAAAADSAAYAAVIDELQQRTLTAVATSAVTATGAVGTTVAAAGAVLRPAPMRTLLLHKLTSAVPTVASEIPLVLRSAVHELPSDRRLVTLDVALVMDLTGSMGSWMTQAKQHLAAIVQALQVDAAIGAVRIAFIGYRDYNDNGRLVSHEFVPLREAEQVLSLLRAQSASGGGDTPEDVLIAYAHALQSLQWQSHIRVLLHVADAPAHGFFSNGGGDRFPKGRCPDQEQPQLDLRNTLLQLKQRLVVNLLFCRINDTTSTMEAMFAEVYDHGAGFGVLPLTAGAAAFKDAVLSSLSQSLLKLLAPADISGLQSFSGGSLSALTTALLSAMRETIQTATLQMGENAAADDTDVAAVEGSSSDSSGGGKEQVKAAIVDAAARSDYARLTAELESGDDLLPVRMAMGMLQSQPSLQQRAARVLLDGGLSVDDLLRHRYPQGIVDALRIAGLQQARKL